MGAVYRARDNYRERDVAIKVAFHKSQSGDGSDARLASSG
jgi:hypothetical protein